MVNKAAWWCAWCLAWAVSFAMAGEPKESYEAEVPVAAQDEAASEAALPQALRLVLGKLVPPEALADGRLYKALLPKAPQYVQSFGYVAVQPGAELPYRLRVRFSEAALNQALGGRRAATPEAERSVESTPADRTAVELAVEGIANLSDLLRVQRHLGALPGSRYLRWQRLQGQTAWFELGMSGGEPAVERQLSASDLLRRIPDTSPLQYRLGL